MSELKISPSPYYGSDVSKFLENCRAPTRPELFYQLNQHLSLVYQTMPREIKVEIANSVSLPFDCILFDSMKAMISPVKVETRIEVKAWRVVANQSLSE